MLSRLRHLRNLSLSEFVVFGQLVILAVLMRVSLRYLPLQRLLDILANTATNRYLRQFPLFHLWSVIPGEQRETRNPGTITCPSDYTDLNQRIPQLAYAGPPLWKRGDRGDFSNWPRRVPLLASPAVLTMQFVIPAQAGIQGGGEGRLDTSVDVIPFDPDYSRLIHLANLAARAIRRDGPCLLRSLIILWLLKARGEQAELLIGVNKESAALQAHAWVETQGTTIGDSMAMTTNFATLVRL